MRRIGAADHDLAIAADTLGWAVALLRLGAVPVDLHELQFAIVATTDDEPNADRAAAEALLHRRVDGLVLSTARAGDDFFEELAARGVPYVLALRTNGQSLASVGDDRLGGYLATRHLLDLGHRRIGLIAGPAHASTARGRTEGYRQAMAEAGAAVDPAWVVEFHVRDQLGC